MRRLSLRSPYVVAVVIVAVASLCLIGALLLHAVVDSRVDVGAVGRVAVAPFIWAGVFGALLSTSVIMGVYWIARRRWLLQRSLAARLVVDPAATAAWAEPLGGPEEHLYFLAEHLAATRFERDDARLLGHALLQVGAHYVLICTLDGRLIDANVAFLARTGLKPEDVRVRSSDRLKGILDLEPLLDLARRSLRDDAALTGIQHEMSVGGQVRPLTVSLRALSLRSGPAVIIVMSDRTHEAQLEYQIDQFTDALELMVDQRVARISAGRNSIDEAMASAGVGVFLFDRDGRTESMNRVAVALTGRTQFSLSTFADVIEVLLAPGADSASLEAWFWGQASGGRPETISSQLGERRAILLRGSENPADESARRVLAVVTLPMDVHLSDEPARDLERSIVEPAPDLSLHQIKVLAALLDGRDYSAAARPYVEVIREAVRRLDADREISGDGASADPAHVTR